MPGGGGVDYGHWRARVWKPAVARAGLRDVTFHDLRRANATALVAEGVNLKTAQTRLGHSDPRLTLAVYAQATTEADRAAAERLADRLMRQDQGARADGCAMNVPSDSAVEPPDEPDNAVTSGFASREGGIRTRGLSVPNAAR